MALSNSRVTGSLTTECLLERSIDGGHPGSARLVGFADATGTDNRSDRAPEEILVASAEDDLTTLTAYGQKGIPTTRYQVHGTLYVHQVFDTLFSTTVVDIAPKLVQLYHDARRQLLVNVSTPYNHSPRGLVCFDVGSSQVLWTNWIAGVPAELEVMDLDGSGRMDILLGSYSVCNGNTLPNGITDYQCHLVALQGDGHTLWSKNVGDDFTWCHPLAVHVAAHALPQPYAWISADEYYRGSPVLFPSEITNLAALAGRLAHGGDPVSAYLSAHLPLTVRRRLSGYRPSDVGSPLLRSILVQELNRLLQGELIFEPRRFAGVALSSETQKYLAIGSKGAHLLRLNRLLLEDAYPDAIQKFSHRCPKKLDEHGTWTEVLPVKPGVGQVVRLDGKGNVLASYDAGCSLFSCFAFDLNGDGADEIIATDRSGYLHVLGPDLKLRDKILITTNAFTSVELKLIGFTNLVAGGKPQLVLSSTQLELLHGVDAGNTKSDTTIFNYRHNEIVVLDRTLRPVLRHEVAPEWTVGPGDGWLKVADVDGDGAAEILVLTDAVTVLKPSRVP